MISCDDLRRLFAKHDECEQTERGLRVSTHCYYPSMDRVGVYVTAYGDGYIVTDGGEAASSAFLHGRDSHAFDSSLKKACARHGLKPKDGALVAEVNDPEWLFAAVLAVANGAAQAAAETSSKVSERKVKQLKRMIHETLVGIVPEHTVATEYTYRGNSGHLWKIDFAVIEPRAPLLLKAIFPEINSIASNYTAFGDISEIHDQSIRRFSVYDTELKSEDKALMLQVAELVPLISLSTGAKAALQRR